MVAVLDELRREIDGIDDALLDLLVRRIEIGQQVAEAKRGATAPPLRPGREAALLKRLIARAGGHIDARSLVRVWREIVALNLGRQIRFSAALCAGPDPRLELLARDHCGAAAPLLARRTPAEVIGAVAGGGALIGVLPGFAAGERWRWWPDLIDQPGQPARPRVIARLPFCRPAAGCDGGADAPDAYVIAAMEPEASGDDVSLFAVAAAGPGAGAALDRTGGPEGWRLIARPGFAERPDGLAGPARWQRLGAYARQAPAIA